MRDIAAADGMMARESHDAIVLSKLVRENRVNQSGSVALTTEAMRGPPWRNLLIIVALLTPCEPGRRGFKSCRARQSLTKLGTSPSFLFCMKPMASATLR